MRLRRNLLVMAAFSLLIAGCGGNGSGALSVTITNPIATIAAGSAAVTLNATVAHDGAMPGVAWTLTAGGAACSPDCGTLSNNTSSSVTYTPPGDLPATPNNSPTITATSNSQSSQSAADVFTIISTAASVPQYISGQYAFTLEGVDPGGNPLTFAGSFTADGGGNITGGEMDINDVTSAISVSPLAGTYTFGGDGRGTISLTNTVSGVSALGFSFTMDTGTNKGQIISLDNNLLAVSGFVEQQDPTVFAARPTGDFVFRMSADYPQRSGAVGRFTLNADGTLSNGLVDASDVINASTLQDNTLGASAATSLPDANGRGTIQLTPTGATTAPFVYYVVDASHFYLFTPGSNLAAGVKTRGFVKKHVSFAAQPHSLAIGDLSSQMFVGVARAQSALTATSVNGTGVFGLIGGDLDTASDPLAVVLVGQMIVSNGTTASVNCDLNDAGSSGQCTGNLPGTVTFDSTTGRGTITFSNGFINSFIDSLAFYLDSNGEGVLLDTTANTQNTYPEALVGDLLPFTAASSLSGNFIGVDLISEPDLPAAVGAFTIADGNVSGAIDASVAGSANGTDLSANGPISSVDSTGRATATITSPLYNGTSSTVEYAVSPSQFFLISIDNDFSSSLGVFQQQTLPMQSEVKHAGKLSSSTTKPFVRVRHNITRTGHRNRQPAQ